MNFVAVAIVSAIFCWPPVQQKSRLLIGLNCIIPCLNNSSQIGNMPKLAKNETKFQISYLSHTSVIRKLISDQVFQKIG